MISEGLKRNSVLTELKMAGNEKQDMKILRLHTILQKEGTDDKIGENGAAMISEGLKCNSTLTRLDLDSIKKKRNVFS